MQWKIGVDIYKINRVDINDPQFYFISFFFIVSDILRKEKCV